MSKYDYDDYYDYGYEYGDDYGYGDSYGQGSSSNPYYDSYGRRIPALADYNVDEHGCKTDRHTRFAISVYDTHEQGVDEMIDYIRDRFPDYCKKGISSSYFATSRVMNDDDYLLVLSYTPDQEREEHEIIVGFAVVSDLRKRSGGDDNSMYIDVICSNNELHHTRFPGGKAIMHAIVEYARDNGYDSVSLKALSSVVNYYRQFGFRFLRNGETDEMERIRHLAELNNTHRISSPSEANRMLLIERAIMFSREVDEEGRPVLNRELLRENLKDELSLESLPTDAEMEDFIKQVPESARDDGTDGLHDLFFSLIKSGYADLKGCPGITKRQFVRPEEVTQGVWKKWMSCEEGGFQMRKLLRPGLSSDPNVDVPIATCALSGGSKRAGKSKIKRTRRNRGSKRQIKRTRRR